MKGLPMPKDDATLSAASVGSHAELTGRLAETIGADPALTQGIRIDVNVHKEPTVTVTMLVDADQVGRIIKMSTWADFTLVKNDELKRLRKRTALTDEEREAIQWAIATLDAEAALGDGRRDAEEAASLRGLLERLG
ncbi:hypothetical protein EBZ80_23355 [bacterium]|nr:hypothetical protein [bacterium]